MGRHPWSAVVEHRYCVPCDVLWDDDASCWVCGRQGIVIERFSDIPGAHVFRGDRNIVPIGSTTMDVSDAV